MYARRFVAGSGASPDLPKRMFGTGVSAVDTAIAVTAAKGKLSDAYERIVHATPPTFRPAGGKAEWTDRMQTYWRLALHAAFRPGVEIGARRDANDVSGERLEPSTVVAPLIGAGMCGAPVVYASHAVARAALMWLRAGDAANKIRGSQGKESVNEGGDDSRSEEAPWCFVVAVREKEDAQALAALLEAAVEGERAGGSLVLEGDDERDYLTNLKVWH